MVGYYYFVVSLPCFDCGTCYLFTDGVDFVNSVGSCVFSGVVGFP